jgi:hypothetical protein
MPRNGKRDVTDAVTLAAQRHHGRGIGRGTGMYGISALGKITTWQRPESG